MALPEAIEACRNSTAYFFKYVSANDAGTTGTHQAGFYMPQEIWPLFLERPGTRGENLSIEITLHWPEGNTTLSRFIWYGKKTRSEYRLTRGFSFLRTDNVGDILIISKDRNLLFHAFLLSSDDEIDAFFDALGISPSHSYRLLRPKSPADPERIFTEAVTPWLKTFSSGFPPSSELSSMARQIYSKLATGKPVTNPDELVVAWISQEFDLFKFIESREYASYLNQGFGSVEEIVQVANTILNRRKSRAGYSLENQIAHIFSQKAILFSSQAETERNKKADFIFPSVEAYGDPAFPAESLTFLGVKTTCKDRWRQILNEADRIGGKHLLTLQQGISSNQLQEMQNYGVTLVVPAPYRKTFPIEYQSSILTLEDFLSLLQQRQASAFSHGLPQGEFLFP